jgi:soluble lytic murein transglycosylase
MSMVNKILSSLCLVGVMQAAWSDDNAFLAAKAAYDSKDIAELSKIYQKKLPTDEWAAYLDYYWLSSRLKEIDSIAVVHFLQTHPTTWLTEQLRREWLLELAERKDWPNYVQFYSGLVWPKTEHKCYGYTARINTGDKAALNAARQEFWLETKNLPPACQELLVLLEQSNSLNKDDYWLRLRLALQRGDKAIARRLAGQLGIDLSLDALTQLGKNPQLYLAKPDVETAIGHELYLAALARYARQNLEQAIDYWQKVQHRFNYQDRPYGWRLLALIAVQRQDPRAVTWFAHSKEVFWPDEDKEWAIRSAIRVQDWPNVLAFIDLLSAENQKQRTWLYWRARAMESQADKTKVVQTLYNQLAIDDDYYGLLAKDRLGGKIASQPEVYVPTEQDKAAVANHPDIQRALALYRLDLRGEAVREWNWVLQNVDDKLLLAAAEAAANVRWYDRAIYASEKTQQLHSYSLRYVTPYKDIVRRYSQELGVDPAWVYGLIRQESRFVINAKSVVGAGGLMQVMPKTAQWVANKLKIPYRSSMVNEIETNVQLGTYYINYVFKQLGSQPVLATAGYNAGPSRAKKWQSSVELPVDVYTETIPFSETRDYVKKVMTNSVHYALGFGDEAQSITKRMGSKIPARQ